MIVLQYARSLAFYFGFVTSTILWGSFSFLVGLCLPVVKRHEFVIRTWVRFVLWWLQVCCNIRTSVEGREHLENGTGILLVKHQSSWDALFSQLLVSPSTNVIKRSLLHIPFFGWAFRVTKPITINRSNRASSLRQLLEQGTERLQQGFWITLFPEGGRTGTGPVADFQPGGALLAAGSGSLVYVVAHNGGHCWPRHGLRKISGEIRVRISEPISAEDKSAKEINAAALGWMRSAMAEFEGNASSGD